MRFDGSGPVRILALILLLAACNFETQPTVTPSASVTTSPTITAAPTIQPTRTGVALDWTDWTVTAGALRIRNTVNGVCDYAGDTFEFVTEGRRVHLDFVAQPSHGFTYRFIIDPLWARGKCIATGTVDNPELYMTQNERKF